MTAERGTGRRGAVHPNKSDGIEAVAAACTEALARGAASADVVLNVLARRREPPRPGAIAPPAVPPAALALAVPPTADCARYDRLRPSCAGARTGEADRATA